MTDDSDPQYFKREWKEQEDGSYIPSDTEIDAVPIEELEQLADEWEELSRSKGFPGQTRPMMGELAQELREVLADYE